MRSRLLPLLCLVLLTSAPAVLGQITFYSGAIAHSTWLSAAGGTPVTLDFEFAYGTPTTNASFASTAAAAGIVFQPFSNGSYPENSDERDGGIGTIGGGWLGNRPAWAASLSFANSAIAWTFNESVRSFGFYDVGTTDGFTVYIFDTNTNLLGNFDTTEQPGTPLFWGFVSTADIGSVQIVPRIGNGYIGIDALSTVAIPEPPLAGITLGLAALLAWRVRRRNAFRV